ncbi:MAG: NAD-dependent epimerase/dehydratase family protein [Deltaproteobacteria bacterium]|nr:NAD-dependent epimerase/dehydratase family protein [Deltaproteobacteria bacterium]
MRTFAITGVCGYIGSLLAEKLAALPDTCVVGLDVKPSCNLKQIKYRQVDIRGKKLSTTLKKDKVDTLVHLAFYTAPEGNEEEARSINVAGTANVLAAARTAQVKRFVLASSAAAYGSHSNNPVPFKESDPLKANDYFYYSAHKARQEELVQQFIAENPGIQTVILRPCVVIGPHINNDTGKSMRQKVLVNMKVPVPIQFIYEDDVAEAFFLAATGTQTGVYNVGTDGTLTITEIGRIMKKRVVLLPFKALYWLASVGKLLRVSPVSGKTVEFISNPIVVDPKKFRQTFGFHPQYDTAGALKKFAASLNF